MKSRTTKSFHRRLAALPAGARRQARTAYNLFRANPSHPGLQFKQIFKPPPTYSVRVGLHYRAVGVLENGVIGWFWIGTHAEYDRLLDTL